MERQPPEKETCPLHGVELYEGKNPAGPGRIRYCPVKECMMPATLIQKKARKPAQFKLPGLEPGLQQNRATWNERQTEVEVEALCRVRNITRLVTSVRYKFQTCPECGHRFRPEGGTGMTKGVPDTLLIPAWMPPGLGILLELKGSDTPFSSVEQAELAARRIILVARSGEEAEDIIEAVRRSLQRAEE